MPRRKLSPIANKVLWALEESGAEEIQTLRATCIEISRTELEDVIRDLVGQELVHIEGGLSEARSEVVLTEAGRKAEVPSGRGNRHPVCMTGGRPLRWSIVGIAIAGVLALGGCTQGKTPSSGFVKDAFGSEAVVFDMVFDGMGSGEIRSREILVVTNLPPADVLNNIAAGGGWRRLGKGLEGRSDGLCVTAVAAQDYVSQEAVFRNASVTDAARRHPKSVVLTLLYC